MKGQVISAVSIFMAFSSGLSAWLQLLAKAYTPLKLKCDFTNKISTHQFQTFLASSQINHLTKQTLKRHLLIPFSNDFLIKL